MQKAAQAYFQTQVQTTSQGQLLLMLYDGAIKFLKQAKQKIEEKDYAKKGILISKAIDVISELDGSLNPEKGGDLATNLHNLYFFCNTRLLQANMKMDTQLIDDVIGILSGLREAYAQITDSPAAAQAAPPPRAKVTAMPKQTAATEPDGEQTPFPANGYGARQPQAGQKPQGAQDSQAPTPPANGAPRQTQPQPGPEQTPANGTAQAAPADGVQKQAGPKAPKPPAQPAAKELEQPQQPTRRSLLAGSNIYRRMSQQQQS